MNRLIIQIQIKGMRAKDKRERSLCTWQKTSEETFPKWFCFEIIVWNSSMPLDGISKGARRRNFFIDKTTMNKENVLKKLPFQCVN